MKSLSGAEFESLEKILLRAAEGKVTRGDRDHLNKTLRENDEARRFVVRQFQNDVLIESELKTSQIASWFEDEVIVPFPDDEVEDKASPSRIVSFLRVAAAVLLISGAFLAGRELTKPRLELGLRDSSVALNPDPDVTEEKLPLGVATLTQSYRAVFGVGKGPDETAFSVGRYDLEEGQIELIFHNGARVMIGGPASFTIDDDRHLTLDHGSLRALVPESAEGFTVVSPHLDVVDQGTEFGVSVGSHKQTEIHVFEGQVDLFDRGLMLEWDSIQEGRALVLNSEGHPHMVLPNDEAFVSAARIGYRRWKDLDLWLRNDPDVVFYFAFDPSDSELDVLENRAVLGDSGIRGRVFGTQWVRGRWREKAALQFEEPEDMVRLDIPGSFPEMTLSTWVRFDRREARYSAILNTDDWEEDEFHWHCYRDGRLQAGRNGVGIWETEYEVVPAGRWTHLAATLDSVEGKVAFYVDGVQVLCEDTPQSDVGVKFGPSTIANWVSSGADEWPPTRYISGRMDEFVMFRRALSKEEIFTLYSGGNGID